MNETQRKAIHDAAMGIEDDLWRYRNLVSSDYLIPSMQITAGQHIKRLEKTLEELRASLD